MINSIGTGIALAFISSITTTSPAWAVNKCVIDGQLVFQDAPCPGKGETLVLRPALGAAKGPTTLAPVSGDGPSKPMSEAQRLEANIAASQKQRRLRELEQRQVPDADLAIRSHLQACKDEQDRLERAKGQYVQNLYGKTDSAQRASEQAAAAARCDTKDRDLRATAAAIRSECQQLGGCK